MPRTGPMSKPGCPGPSIDDVFTERTGVELKGESEPVKLYAPSA
jgi:hypothetical protein